MGDRLQNHWPARRSDPSVDLRAGFLAGEPETSVPQRVREESARRGRRSLEMVGEGVIVTATSSVDGYLGAATVAPAVGSGVVQTDWWLVIDPPLSTGAHLLTVDALDEGGVVRSVEVSIVAP